jgi:hypothetical protein
VKTYSPHYFFHIAEPANLASIRRHGLLSTEQLMKLAGVRKADLNLALGRHRPDQVILPNGVIIRDQSPMPPRSLAPALPQGMEPNDWYKFLNGFVFLWASQKRVDRHLSAFRGRKQALLVFDAARLLDMMGDQLLLSPINSGNAMRRAAPRSHDLFVPYQTWLEAGWPVIAGQARPKSTAPAEIVFRDRLALKPCLVEIREF